jgi:xanthine dehydrogenase accessory factor
VRLLESTPAVVRVVIASMRGSAPRDPGACLLITPTGIEGTIGGGHLELEAIESARALLDADEGEPAVHIRPLVLGRDLRQCCGGAVQLWFERFTAADLPLLQAAAHAAQNSDSAMLESDFDGVRVTRWLIDAKAPESLRLVKSIAATHQSEEFRRKRDGVRKLRTHAAAPLGDSDQVNEPSDTDTGSFPSLQFTPSSAHAGTLLERLSAPKQALWVFGAGHVGQAVVRALSELPFDVTWVDSRPGVLPTSLPANVRPLGEPQPTELLTEAPEGAMYLVLTHDHSLDYSLCYAILQRNAFAWLGLIGSESKAASFRSRLRKDGISQALVEKLVCPIGIEGIESKAPAAIAVAVAAQLLQKLGAPSQNVLADSPKASRSVGSKIANIKIRSEPARSQSGAHECGERCEGCNETGEKSP